MRVNTALVRFLVVTRFSCLCLGPTFPGIPATVTKLRERLYPMPSPGQAQSGRLPALRAPNLTRHGCSTSASGGVEKVDSRESRCIGTNDANDGIGEKGGKAGENRDLFFFYFFFDTALIASSFLASQTSISPLPWQEFAEDDAYWQSRYIGITFWPRKAGEGTRTLDVQLGKLAFCH